MAFSSLYGLTWPWKSNSFILSYRTLWFFTYLLCCLPFVSKLKSFNRPEIFPFHPNFGVLDVLRLNKIASIQSCKWRLDLDDVTLFVVSEFQSLAKAFAFQWGKWHSSPRRPLPRKALAGLLESRMLPFTSAPPRLINQMWLQAWKWGARVGFMPMWRRSTEWPLLTHSFKNIVYRSMFV